MKVFFIGLVLFQSVLLDVLLSGETLSTDTSLDAPCGVNSSMRILVGVSF